MKRAEVKRRVSVELKMLRAIKPARIDDSDDESAVKVVADDASAIGPEDGGRTGERKVSDRHCRLSLSKDQRLTEETEDEPGLEVGRVKEREKLDVGDLLSASEGGRQRSEGGEAGRQKERLHLDDAARDGLHCVPEYELARIPSAGRHVDIDVVGHVRPEVGLAAACREDDADRRRDGDERDEDA
jgi:hypothetical protein